MSITSVTYRREDGTFVAVVNGLPYHVTPDSEYWAAAQELGANAPMEPPLIFPHPTLAEQRARWSMTDIQFAIAASSAPFNLLTDQEAQDWAGAGVIPAIGVAALATISDENARREATIRFRGARTFARLDPFIVGVLQPFIGMTDEQVDAFFALGMSK